MPNRFALERANSTIGSYSPYVWFDPSKLPGGNRRIYALPNFGSYRGQWSIREKTAASAPTSVSAGKNNLNTLRSGGTDSGYTVGTKNGSFCGFTLTNFTSFWVERATGAGQFSSQFGLCSNNAARPNVYIGLVDNSTRQRGVQSNTAAASALSTSFPSNNTWVITRCSYDGSTLSIFINGVLESTRSGSGYQFSIDQAFMYHSTSYSNPWESGDSLLFDSFLSLSAQAEIEASLNTKWSIY